jgi:hypothetical protein
MKISLTMGCKFFVIGHKHETVRPIANNGGDVLTKSPAK